MIRNIIRFALALIILLVQLPPLEAFDYDNPYSPTNINTSLPDTVRRPDANFQSSYFNPRSLNLNLIPDFNIDLNTLRLPKFDVRDIGNSVWTYQKENYSFNSDLKLATAYSAKIQFTFDGNPAPDVVSMDLSKMTYTPGSVTPTDFKQTYRDSKGASVQIERTHQAGEKNPSYESFETFFANEERKNADVTVPPAPSKELVSGFDETWRVSSREESGKPIDSKINLSVDSMKYDSALKRHLTGYSGTITDGKINLTFTVTAPRDDRNNVKSVQCQIKSPGAPTVNVTWNPKEGTNPDQAFALLKDHLPVPVFVGPRSSFRFNGTDMAELPLKVTGNGDIAIKQFGDAKDISALFGKEDLEIKVEVSAPDAESSKSRFSVGNALKNVWYMVTGKWADVKAMRQSLTSLRDTAPEKFLLAAGFSDPGFMSLSDLKAAYQKLSIAPSGQDNKNTDAIPAAKNQESFVFGFIRNAIKIPSQVIGVALDLPGVKQVWMGTRLSVGFAQGIMSGDQFDTPNKVRFDKTGPALMALPGMTTIDSLARDRSERMEKYFQISESTLIRNNTHGMVRDLFQAIGYELLGSIDKPAIQTAKALRIAINERGEVYVVAHSQGTAIFHQALSLLTKEEKSKIHYLGVGPEWIIDAKTEGLADATNVWNEGDPVPAFGNRLNLLINLLLPGNWGRLSKDDVKSQNVGAKWGLDAHGFDKYEAVIKSWLEQRRQEWNSRNLPQGY